MLKVSTLPWHKRSSLWPVRACYSLWTVKWVPAPKRFFKQVGLNFTGSSSVSVSILFILLGAGYCTFFVFQGGFEKWRLELLLGTKLLQTVTIILYRLDFVVAFWFNTSISDSLNSFLATKPYCLESSQNVRSQGPKIQRNWIALLTVGNNEWEFEQEKSTRVECDTSCFI